MKKVLMTIDSDEVIRDLAHEMESRMALFKVQAEAIDKGVAKVRKEFWTKAEARLKDLGKIEPDYNGEYALGLNVHENILFKTSCNHDSKNMAEIMDKISDMLDKLKDGEDE